MAEFKEKDPKWYAQALSRANKIVELHRIESPKTAGKGDQLTNTETRLWYLSFVSIIEKYDQYLQTKDITLEERARRIYDVRHTARIESRERMKDQGALAFIQDRDEKMYGSVNGPSFEFTLAKEIEKIKKFVGKSEYNESEETFIKNKALEGTIGSAQRPNEEVSKAVLGTTSIAPKL